MLALSSPREESVKAPSLRLGGFRKESDMRNRKVQRKVRRMVGKEEKLDLVDYCGIKDPTPYEAVKNIIRRERAANRKQPAHTRVVEPATA